MNAAKLNDWLQVVGFFGVIASLIFVGLQMKQAHEIALSETYQARATAAMEMLVAMASTPEFTTSQAKLYADEVDAITPAERVSQGYFFAALMVKYENEFFQYEQGFLSEEHWAKDLRELNCMFRHPFYQSLYKDSWDFRDSFESLIRDAIAHPEMAASDCWVPISE